MGITIADVEAARRTIAGQVLRTPMLPAPKLSALTGAEVYVKYENLQVTNSFKDRGALNKLASLSESARARGVIAMSAGNHAHAVDNPCHHRHAGDDAVREGGGDAGTRR
jgi:threonine dehydratase